MLCDCTVGHHAHDYEKRVRFDRCPKCGTQWQCGYASEFAPGRCAIGYLPLHEVPTTNEENN